MPPLSPQRLREILGEPPDTCGGTSCDDGVPVRVAGEARRPVLVPEIKTKPAPKREKKPRPMANCLGPSAAYYAMKLSAAERGLMSGVGSGYASHERAGTRCREQRRVAAMRRKKIP